MKKVLLTIFLAVSALMVKSQDITGTWHGKLSVQGQELRLVFHINQTESGFSATMDSPDQNARGIPVGSVTFENQELELKLPALMAAYKGMYSEGKIRGTFTQGGMSFDMPLTREMAERALPRRPQEPAGTLPYRSEDVQFENAADKITLAGTLTIPEGTGPFPAVVLISGSGPQNRNSEVFGHKPFLVLSDYLTRNGIAVLRYDDRGTAASGGDFSKATSVEFSRDALAAVAYLKSRKEVAPGKIGLAGHSEGGIIAPLAAVSSTDVAFLVLLAGPGLPGARILKLQQEMIGRVSQVPEKELREAGELNREAFAIVQSTDDIKEMEEKLHDFFSSRMEGIVGAQKPQGMDNNTYITSLVRQLANPWMKFFLSHDPAPVLEQIKSPVLVLIGEKDLQVPADENLKAIGEAFGKGGNTKVTLRKLSGLNHLFQECQTGSPAEYALIEQTFSENAMEEIVRFVRETTR
jgi:hypothetical protein